MNQAINHIKCPNCQYEIDVNHVLSQQLERNIRAEFQQKQKIVETELKQANERLQAEQKAFEEKKQHENELFKSRIEKERHELAQKLQLEITKKITSEYLDAQNLLKKELNEKTEKIKLLYKKDAEISRLEREKSELKEKLDAENQAKLNTLLHEEKNKIRKIEEERNELKIKELQKQLEDQKRLTEEMKRKQEQGSMQLQGEVQELYLEEWLSAQFPLDYIEEISKGIRGGDCIQVINTREHQNCGKIYYESKRTKDFQNTWIEKFKQDMRDRNADVGILVTKTMPTDMPRMGLREGIWICTLEEFKSLSAVMRESVIKLHLALRSQVNKGDKMQLLYDYLTGNTFRMQIEAIVEGFTTMKNELEREKRAMNRIWKEREKQIDKVIFNTIDMHASIKGIAGNAIPTVPSLELDLHNPELDFDNN